MPLVSLEDDLTPYTQDAPVEQDFSIGEVTGAAFGVESAPYAVYRSIKNPLPEVTEQALYSYETGAFKPLDYISGSRHDTDERRYKYAELKSPEQVAWQDNRFDEEDADNNILNASPFYITAVPVMGAALLSPTTLIMGGAGAATKGARAMEYGIKAMSATAMDEIALQSHQDTRSWEKSGLIVGSAGLLGAGVGAITGKSAVPKVSEEFAGPMPKAQMTGGSGGAAKVSTADPRKVDAVYADTTLNADQKFIKIADLEAEVHNPVNPLAAKIAGLGFMHKVIPEQRIMFNKNPIMRSFGDDLINHPLLVKGNFEFKGRLPLEEISRLPQKKIDHNIPLIFNEGYAKYSKNFTGTKMTKEEFDWQVQLAGTRKGAHPDPEISATAKRVMSEWLQPLEERLIKAGQLEEGKLLGDETWWVRNFSPGEALSRTPEEYADWLMPAIIKKLESRVKAGGEDGLLAAKRLTTKGLKKEHKRLMGMRDSLAYGSREFGSEYTGVGVMKDKDGILKTVRARTLDVATEDLPRESLRLDTVKGLTQRLKAYERQLAAYEDPRFGDPTFANFRKSRQDFYNAELGELKRSGGTNKQIKKLGETLKKDLDEINAFAHRYNGVKSTVISATAQNVTSTILAANSITKLGRAILSQIPELVSTVGSVGGYGVTSHLVSNVLNPKVMRGMARTVRRDMAAGIEVASSLRFAEKGLFDDTAPAWAKMMNRGSDFVVDKAFGIGYWTRFIRAEATVMVQSKIGRLMLKETLSKRNKIELSRMGITEDLIPGIRAQVRANHNNISGGTIDMGLGKWNNNSLRNHVETAIAGDVKHYQLEPGIGSIPFLGDTVHGALLLQFKSFILMATSRHLMAGVQKATTGDGKAISQMILMSAAGSLGYALRSQSYNREADLSPERLFREGMMRGGWFGASGDINAVLEQFSGGQLSAFNALGFEQKTSSNYFGARSIYSTGIGPTGQFMKDIIDGTMGAYGMIVNGEASKAQIRSLRRITPLNNYVVINTPMFEPINNAENYLIDTFAGGSSKRGFLK